MAYHLRPQQYTAVPGRDIEDYPPYRDHQAGMERHDYQATPGLEVAGQDMDSQIKSNLTPPPPGLRGEPSSQPPAHGYFAPSSQGAPSNHSQEHVYASAHHQPPAPIESYRSAPTTAPYSAESYNPHGSQHLDPNRTAYQGHGASSMHGAPSMAAVSIPAMSRANSSGPYSPTSSFPEKRQERRQATICGLYPATFFLSVALAAVILIAAIAGGVGGTMAVKEARTNALAECASKPAVTSGASPTTESGASSTNISQKFKDPGQVIVDLDCPNIDQKNMMIDMRGQRMTFTPQCGTDYYVDQIDLIATVAYTFENCVKACAAMNSYLARTSVKNATCIAVVFNANMPNNVDLHGGNCWLKSKIGAAKTVSGLDTVAAAILRSTTNISS